MKNVGKLSDNIGEKVWWSVVNQICGVIGNIVTIQHFEQAKNQLKNQVMNQVSVQAWQEVKQNVKLCGI
jgi:ACT domain-containing protein